MFARLTYHPLIFFVSATTAATAVSQEPPAQPLRPAQPAAAKPAETPAQPTEPAPAKPEATSTISNEPEPEAAKPILITKREITAQLQIFLDQKMFSPGRIDGVPGKFLSNALKRWQRSQGLPETGVLDDKVPLDSIHPVYAFHTFDKAELKYIGTLESKPSLQAKQKFLPYASYGEYLSERYHCSTEFLMRLNPGVKLNQLKQGDQVRVPNVQPFKIEALPPTGNLPENPSFANRRIVVTRKDTILDLYDGDQLLASVPIAPGSAKHPTPAGKWKLVGVASMPTFRWDKGVLERGVRTENFHMLPAGPNNPVGVGWLGLNKPGIGIHGTNNPYSIGSFASHGCMRTANWDVARLAHMVTKGIPVEIK